VHAALGKHCRTIALEVVVGRPLRRNLQALTAVRNFVNRISGSQRILAHGQIYPGLHNLEFMERQIQENHPDSWKGYNIAFAAKADDDPNSPMRRWRLDEKVVYPTYELIARHKAAETHVGVGTARHYRKARWLRQTP